MKPIRNIFTGLFILGGFVALLNLLQAQEVQTTVISAEPLPITGREVASFSSFSEAEVAALASLLDATPTIPASELPVAGTFWSLQNPNSAPFPADLHQLPGWQMSGNSFLLNDLDFDYLAAGKKSLVSGGLQTMSIPSPEDGEGDGGTNLFEFNTLMAPVDYGTNLWIAEVAVAAGQLTGIGSNTLADVSYEIQSRTNLVEGDWFSEGFILGSETTNWTPLSVTQGDRTNLFLRLRSWADDGSGLPIWWQLQYFGTNGVDSYANPAGDGWNNLQKFQNGMIPNTFYTPPTPQGLTAIYNTSTHDAAVSWLSSPSPVTGYTVQDSAGATFDFAAGTNRFTADLSAVLPSAWNSGNIDKYYKIKAHYPDGDSDWSDWVSVLQSPIAARIIAGPQGTALLAVSVIPPNTAAIRLTAIDDFSYPYEIITNYDISISNFTNGLCPLSNVMVPGDGNSRRAGGYSWYGQAVGTNGHGLTAATGLGQDYTSPQDNYQNMWLVPPYFDGRQQLKQNLIFQLRAALADRPFQFLRNFYDGIYVRQIFVTSTTNYANAGFYSFAQYTFNEGIEYSPVFDTFRPYAENYLYRNFVFNSAELDLDGRTATGAGGEYPAGLTLDVLPAYQFSAPTENGAAISSVLATSQTRWLCSYPFDSANSYLNTIGVDYDSEAAVFTMTSNARNFFGLTNLSAAIGFGGPATTALYAGGSSAQGGYFYPETAQPIFSTIEYDFFSPYGIWDEASQTLINPTMPEVPGFSSTNRSQLFIVASGSQTQIAGYAKLAVVNGYSGVYAYLAQYFDKAYKITNGIVTTNTTGVLSSYGNFFATEPGPVALVTMPDLDTGARGTCAVYSVSLQLDKNHDGIMDLNFNGADTTSQGQPMQFWVNNDWDMSFSTSDLGHDVYSPVKDYNDGFIESQRDLEDLARLWICGMPALPSGSYQVTLSWANVSSGSPAINLFSAAETNGGTAYLTDTNIASAQTYYSPSTFIGPGYKIATITAGQSFTFPASYFTNGSNKNFLFEGACTNGSGELVLTILQNSNVIAQTGAWLDLHNVKDMFEHAHVENEPVSPPSSTLTDQSTYKEDNFVPVNANDGKQSIVFVHGWRVTPWVAENFSQTMFKRLWWQGYQGRFAALHWPTLTAETDGPLGQFLTFNRDEYIAFKCAQGAANYFLRLQSRFPDYSINACAHSHGNVLMMEVLKRHLAAGQSPIHNYALLQAAVAAECLDTNAPLHADFVVAQPPTPDSFYGYAGSVSNAITGSMINFYNPNDFGVVTCWQPNQVLYKPDGRGWYQYITNAPFQTPVGSSRAITDPHELMAFMSRPRTQAVGAMPELGGSLSTLNQVDLATLVGFDRNWDEHSGEFNWNI